MYLDDILSRNLISNSFQDIGNRNRTAVVLFICISKIFSLPVDIAQGALRKKRLGTALECAGH